MIYSQKDIFDYLSANPLGTRVAVGDVSNVNGSDYIFLSFTNEGLISYDNGATYQTYIQITVATRDYEDRRKLVDYVKDYLTVTITYDKAIDFEYFLARCTCGVLMHEEQES